MQPANSGGPSAATSELDVLKKILDQLIPTVSAAKDEFVDIKTKTTSWGDDLQKMLGSMASSGQSVQAMGTAAIEMVPGLGEAKAAFDVAKASVKEFADMVTSYVSAFSPGEVYVFQRALTDLNAVIGYELQPVMRLMTQMVRDVANSLFADASRVREQIQRTVDSVSESWKAMQPTVDLLTKEFGDLVINTAKLVELFAMLNKYTSLEGLFGQLFGPAERPDATGLGAGAGGVTDPLAAFRDMQQKALQGGGAGPVTKSQSEKQHDELMEWLKSKNETLANVFGAMEWILNHLPGSMIDSKTAFARAVQASQRLKQLLQ